MFKIFPFQFSGVFNINQLGDIARGVGGVIYSILENGYMDEIFKEYTDEVSNRYETETIEKSNDNFAELKQDEDMYLLIIDLKGIDIRELSIRYDQGIIEINVNRLEIENNGFERFSSNTIVKKRYSMKFKDIEEIDTSKLIKTIDDGILKIRMPKKYVLNEFSNVVDVEIYDENKIRR